MARTGRSKAELPLTDEELEQLLRWTRRRKSSLALALRPRFVELNLEGLSHDPRPGRPATISTDHAEDIVLATLESNPESATHWSCSKMA